VRVKVGVGAERFCSVSLGCNILVGVLLVKRFREVLSGGALAMVACSIYRIDQTNPKAEN